MSLLRGPAHRAYLDIANGLEWRSETHVYYEDVYASMLSSPRRPGGRSRTGRVRRGRHAVRPSRSFGRGARPLLRVESPDVFVFEAEDELAAADALAGRTAELGVAAPLPVVSAHGLRLASRLQGLAAATPAPGADQAWAADMGSLAHRSGADSVVAVGGGRCLDLGKLIAARAGLPLISVPTQLSHDGICSPVAVVPDREGRAQSIGAAQPRAVFLSIPTLMQAPPDSVGAGLGDMLANPWR